MSGSNFFIPPLAVARANPQAIFQFAHVRFSLLTSRLLRIEYSEAGRFEDRASQVFWYRNQPIPRANISKNDQDLSIETGAYRLTYQDSPAGLPRESLQVTILETGVIIHLDDPNPEILAGTTRTLDETNGPVQLQPGLLSRSGWVQLDDTRSLVFDASGWVTPRPDQSGYRDLYLLVSGSDYKTALQEYQQIAGRPSLLPRAFLGNWWSHFWEYSQEELQSLVERFQKEQIPLSVLIIDMDWHITKTGNACSGWTGFSWNRTLFPDPPGFLKWMHEQGLITSLNLHPAEGIHPHEENYKKAAKALAMDPAKEVPIPFDIDDQTFTQVYFEEILHPLEEQGVDFWWLDWQQGDQVKMPGLDPLWWLNHLHFFDLGRDKKKRPVVFSRWGGPGNHRYPIGFSGDTVVSWKSLAFQPYFTSTAANAAYGWWSHDIGGHMQGMEDPELYTRWVQFGVLSPIFRLHCAKDLRISRLPWAFGAEVLRLTRQAMQFRKALIPYLYSMAWRNVKQGLPLISPLYHDWPKEEAAYAADGQYLFGSELMAAPVTTPLDPKLKKIRQDIWFPPGEYFNFFTGKRYVGPGWRTESYGLEDMPLFARAGAVIPLQAETTRNGVENPENILLMIFPGGNNHFTLYEDDGKTQEYVNNGGCRTDFDTHWAESILSLQISPPAGDLKCVPYKRTYRILFRGISRPAGIEAFVNGVPLNPSVEYDEASHTAAVEPVSLDINECLTVSVYLGDSLL